MYIMLDEAYIASLWKPPPRLPISWVVTPRRKRALFIRHCAMNREFLSVQDISLHREVYIVGIKLTTKPATSYQALRLSDALS